MLRLSQLPISLLASLLAATWLPGRLLSAGASPTINVAMKAAFPSPPYLVELLETATLDNATRYYALLDDVAMGRFAGATTDRDLYAKFLHILQQDGHMDAEALSTFKLALSMRSAAPRIEAQYRFYATTVEPFLPDDQEACADCWVLLDGKQHCSPELLANPGAGRSLKTNSSSKTQEQTLPYDRVLHAPGTREAILYADITSPAFAAFHEAARGLARQKEASYRVRYRKTAGHVEEPLSVNGYGVELGLKRTDYIVLDDRAGSNAQENKDGEAKAEDQEGGDVKKTGHGQVVMLDEEEEMMDIKPLEKSELAPLAMKAASFVMQSDLPLDTLLKLTQDFPRYSTKLGGHNVSAEFEAEYVQNRQIGVVPAGANVLWMNGVQLLERQIQPFGLVDLLWRERKLIQGVLDLGLTGEQAVSLLGHSQVAQGRAEADEMPRFDWRDNVEVGIEVTTTGDDKVIEDDDEEMQGGEAAGEKQDEETKIQEHRPHVIIWLNNLEKDKRYDGYSSHLWTLLLQGRAGKACPGFGRIYSISSSLSTSASPRICTWS